MFDKNEANLPDESQCIRCGRCVRVWLLRLCLPRQTVPHAEYPRREGVFAYLGIDTPSELCQVDPFNQTDYDLAIFEIFK